MKKLVLIIHVDLKQDVADLLRTLEQVDGFTFSSVEGHSSQSGENLSLSDRDKVVGYTPRSRIDIVLEDEDVELVLTKIRESDMGLKKHAIYWISAIEQFGRL